VVNVQQLVLNEGAVEGVANQMQVSDLGNQASSSLDIFNLHFRLESLKLGRNVSQVNGALNQKDLPR